MNLPGAHAYQELHSLKLYTSPNYANIANKVHIIAKTPLMANLAIKSYGPIPVPIDCVKPVPTKSTPSNIFSLHFSYEQVAFSILKTSFQEELAKYHYQTVGSPLKVIFLRSIWDHSS